MIDLLGEIGRWMSVNNEAIYGTRPFSPVACGEMRFTTKGNVLNIIIREWPTNGRAVIESIHAAAPLKVEKITMLGGPTTLTRGGSDLRFQQDGAALTIDLPSRPGELTAPYVLQAHCDQPTQPGWIK